MVTNTSMVLQACGAMSGVMDKMITDAMIKQIKTLQHSTLFGLANEPSINLAEKLLKIAKGNG